MKIFLLCCLLAVSTLLRAGEIDSKTVVISRKPKIWETFLLSEVRLLPGSPFYQTMQVSQRYLLDVDIERMLNQRRKPLGISLKGAYQGSNQPENTRATDWHHYISGTSLMYAQTGDWGNEMEEHDFDIYVDDRKIATESLFDKHPMTFYEEVYEIPSDLTKGKETVRLRFQSHSNKKAGTVFALKVTTRPELFPNYSFYF